MQTFTALNRRGQLRELRKLAHAALQQYDLSQPRLAPLKHEHNTTFRVHDAGGHRYGLRVHRPGQHLQQAIQSELLWLEALHRDTALAVPLPVPTRAGSLLTVAEAEGVPEARVCVLFHWLKGRYVGND